MSQGVKWTLELIIYNYDDQHTGISVVYILSLLPKIILIVLANYLVVNKYLVNMYLLSTRLH